MDPIIDLANAMITQLQKPTIAFLLGGMLLAALGSKLVVPEAVYKFIVMVLLLKVGLSAGISMQQAELAQIVLPAIAAAILGVLIVGLGAIALARRSGVSRMDAMATAGLFGAVSASTLAVGMGMLDDEGIAYEGFIGALYPFMDVAALVTAIVIARMGAARAQVASGGTITVGSGGVEPGQIRAILVDTLQSPAISALLLGIFIGLYAAPQQLVDGFYGLLFHGFLSILMLVMGMEAWQRLGEMRKVAHVYLLYGLTAPLIHGVMGLGAGVLLHEWVGFSAGGAVLLAVLAGSSSDISGPPTLRAALPEANPSAYVGTSTGIGTPVAILAIPLWIALADMWIGL